MDFISLVMHGVSAISVYNGIVGVRFLVFSVLLAILALFGAMVVVIVRLTTDLAIPGWATAAAGLSLILLTQAFTMAMVFVFVILGSRNNLTFLPLRDYHHFVLGERTLCSPANTLVAGPQDGAREMASGR